MKLLAYSRRRQDNGYTRCSGILSIQGYTFDTRVYSQYAGILETTVILDKPVYSRHRALDYRAEVDTGTGRSTGQYGLEKERVEVE